MISLLTQLARRMVAVLTTHAHYERVFSCVGKNVVTETCNLLSPEHVELLVFFLRRRWQMAEEHGVLIETEGTLKAAAKTVCVKDS